MTAHDYLTQCAWCRTELHERFITFLPAYDHQFEEGLDPGEVAMRYCSAGCVTKRRDELFHRHKPYGEKWDRWTAEIPPELTAMIEMAVKRRLGVNRSAFSRANVVRAALRRYLNEILPVPELPTGVDSTADEITELLLESDT